MHKVIDELPLNGKTILTLNDVRPLTEYNSYRIGGKVYAPISVSGSQKWIAVEGNGGFIGKEVEFVSA